MAKLTTSPLGSFSQSGLTTLNANLDAIEVALENTLSRDGTSPNQMTGDIDMNENDIFNVGTLDMETLSVTDLDVETLTAGTVTTDILYIDGVRAVPAELAGTIPPFPAMVAANKFKTLQADITGLGFEFRRSPFYNVYDYGATGNGTTDDTAALVATQTAANACEGQISGIRGRGVIVVPTGFFKVTGIVTQNSGEKWLGLGGRLDAANSAMTVFECGHGSCIIENIFFLNAFRPTSAVGVFKHSNLTTGSPDCKFINLKIQGGYYGFQGDGGGDSYNFNMIISSCMADFVYLIRYNGMWAYRGKWDGSYPVQEPISTNIKGSWTASTLYAVGDLVQGVGGYIYQARVGGNSAATGSGPSPDLVTVDLPDGPDTLIWRTHRIANSAALKIDSQCFINVFHNCDLTGGHAYGVHTLNSLGTTAPQTVWFTQCEVNIPRLTGLNLVAVQDLQWHGGLIAGGISSISVGVRCDSAEGVQIMGSHIRGFVDGVFITANAKRVRVANTMFYQNTDCVEAAASAARFDIRGNDLSGSSTLWGLNTTGVRIGAGCTNFKVISNDVGDCINGVIDGSTNDVLTKKIIRDNI